MQNALEPSGEARCAAHRDGFRPGRSGHEAMAQGHTSLKKGRERWRLDADMRGAFANSSHECMLNALGETPGRAMLAQWLNAGDVEAEMCHATRRGTPQGGSVSPR